MNVLDFAKEVEAIERFYPEPHTDKEVIAAYQRRVEQLETINASLAAEIDRLMAEKGEQV